MDHFQSVYHFLYVENNCSKRKSFCCTSWRGGNDILYKAFTAHQEEPEKSVCAYVCLAFIQVYHGAIRWDVVVWSIFQTDKVSTAMTQVWENLHMDQKHIAIQFNWWETEYNMEQPLSKTKISPVEGRCCHQKRKLNPHFLAKPRSFRGRWGHKRGTRLKRELASTWGSMRHS